MIASIQKIISIEPIEGADKIEVATILGWKVVVKKGEFHVGDLCVYIEIDSVLPDKPEFDFLRKNNFRIRTIKLKGQISQGIAFPISILPENTIEEGTDVTDMLGVIHYEKPIPVHLRGKIKGSFPSFLTKTDETRIQSVPEVIFEMQGIQYVATMKMDGTSGSFYKKNGEFGVCSRNLSLEEDDTNMYWMIEKKYNIKENLPNGYSIQGEICGPGIQGNKMGFKENKLLVFNVIEIQGHRYLNYSEMVDFCNLRNLERVPAVEYGIFDYKSIDELLDIASALKYPNGSLAEGVVFRPLIEMYSKALKGRMSFKVVSNEFMLENKE